MITRLVGVRIKELRNELGLSQEAFANRIDMARTYFAEVETGNRNVSIRNLLKIVNGLGVTLECFFDSPLFDQAYEDALPILQKWIVLKSGRAGKVSAIDASHRMVDVPLFGTIAAGTPAESVIASETYPVPADFLEKMKGAFLLRVSGESMNRILPNGSLALVQPCTEFASPSDLYVVSVGGTDATVKRIARHRGGLELLPDSTDPSFKPLPYDNESLDEITVIGRVVRFMTPPNALPKVP